MFKFTVCVAEGKDLDEYLRRIGHEISELGLTADDFAEEPDDARPWAIIDKDSDKVVYRTESFSDAKLHCIDLADFVESYGESPRLAVVWRPETREDGGKKLW